MTCFWRLNGTELQDVEVKVSPTKLSVQQRIRQAKTPLHNDLEYREALGSDLADFTIEILFLGKGDAKFDQTTFITNILDTDDVWTLEAPDELPIYVYKNEKRAALSCESWKLDPKGTGVAALVLSIDALLNGVWIGDGGSYCEPLSGYFTRQVDGTYLRQDGVNTGLKPLIELPDQTGGYPIATTPAFGSGSPLPTSLRVDEVGRTFKTYDLTGFLVPAPVATGDVGVYEVCSSPTVDFLAVGVDILIGTSGGLPVLLACESLLETGFGIDEGVDILNGIHVQITDDGIEYDEGVDTLEGDEEGGTESFSKAESVTVVNS